MTRQELFKVRSLAHKINQHEKYLRGLRELIDNAERLMGAMTGMTSRKVETLTVKIISTEEKLKNLRGQLDDSKRELLEKILAEYDEPELQTMLILRYVECLTWSQIAAQMNMSRRNVYRLNQNFIRHLDAHSES